MGISKSAWWALRPELTDKEESELSSGAGYATFPPKVPGVHLLLFPAKMPSRRYARPLLACIDQHLTALALALVISGEAPRDMSLRRGASTGDSVSLQHL